MSYIIKSTSPFVSIKLTEIGRESLSKGQLNFAFWAIGDSEINYDRETIVDANPNNSSLSGSSKILRPFDRQPNIKSYITSNGGSFLNTLNSSNISVVKAVVNNKAKERGFFSGTTGNYQTLTASTYINGLSNVPQTKITGGTQIEISTGITVNVGDFIRLKVNQSSVYPTGATENLLALPNLWYKVQSTASTLTSTTITVDRRLPNLSTGFTNNSYVFVYKGGEVANSYGSDTSTAYWDSGTLTFDSATNITCDDVKIWNMNNVWCENLAGITGLTTTKLYEDYTKFGSYDYLGAKNPYLEYLCQSTGQVEFECNGPGYSYPDTVKKSISVLHYTNNTISNLYGEFFYLDSRNSQNLVINIPDIMYHRRNYSTGQGIEMGMRFTSSGTTNFITNTDIEYVNLYEDPSYVDGTAKIVGKVFPQLKLVVFDDDEIVATMSYKSNRNWTLPSLSALLTAPTGGTASGLLAINKTIYLTYALDNLSATGLTQALPCQNYVKVTNNTSATKDIAFKIEDLDLLPYMKKVESLSYDGLGFYATNFKLIYQIVDDQNQRPDPSAWKFYDYTTTALTQNSGVTINPLILENQSPYSNSSCDGQNGFILNNNINQLSSTYGITTSLSMAPNTQPEILQFGDERFFYGNIDTYIGATIYKTIFDIRINTSQYNLTSNPTRSQNTSTSLPNIKVSEIAIYDSNKNLVIIGKLSEPTSLVPGNTIMLELSLDF
jgi:hypothetical protein